jgi:cellulose synthase/poly-beta-1,6-N-acetylglucosamine synthase-like glycosyltransferase
LERSVTVVLPVHNAESTLHSTVQEILDVLPDLTRRFDVLIVDDDSTDGTSEIAHDLARHYPQVQVCCRRRGLSRSAAIRAALEQSRGEVVLLHEEDQGTPIDAIHRLWQAIGRRGFAFDPPQAMLATAGNRPRIGPCVPRPGFRVISTAAGATADETAVVHFSRRRT